MRQRPGTGITHILEYVREKRRNKFAHTYYRGIRWQKVIGMNNFARKAGINNPKIAH